MVQNIWARYSTTTRARVGEVCLLPLPLPCFLSFWSIHIAQCVLHLHCMQTKWEGRTDDKFWNVSKALSTNLFFIFLGFGGFFKQYIPILLVNNINTARSRRAQVPLCRTYADTALRENLVATEGPRCTSFSLPNCCTQILVKPFFLGELTTKCSLLALNQHCWENMLLVTGHINPPAVLSNCMCPLSGANDIQHLELGLIPLGMRLQSS